MAAFIRSRSTHGGPPALSTEYDGLPNSSTFPILIWNSVWELVQVEDGHVAILYNKYKTYICSALHFNPLIARSLSAPALYVKSPCTSDWASLRCQNGVQEARCLLRPRNCRKAVTVFTSHLPFSAFEPCQQMAYHSRRTHTEAPRKRRSSHRLFSRHSLLHLPAHTVGSTHNLLY